MAKCEQCGRSVIAGLYGTQEILLDPEARCFAAVAEHHIYAEDGDKLFLSLALVEHRAVCPGTRRSGSRPGSQRQTGAETI